MATTDAWEQETAAAWDGLEGRLATWLAEVPPDETVHLELAWGGDLEGAVPYVQISIDGLTVRSEAVSDHYLDAQFALGPERTEALLDLGWQVAGADGTRNLWREDEIPEDAYDLATGLVAALRDVYGVPAPSFLVTSGFGDEGTLEADDLPFDLRVATPPEPEVDLTVEVASDPDALRDLVADALSSVVDEVEFDPDGDIPVPAGDTAVYVRVDEDVPAVALWAPVLSEVRWTPRVGHTLNEVNKATRYGRVVFHAGHVLVEYRLDCRPFVPELLRNAVLGMTHLVDGLDTRLQERIGGRTLADS